MIIRSTYLRCCLSLFSTEDVTLPAPTKLRPSNDSLTSENDRTGAPILYQEMEVSMTLIYVYIYMYVCMYVCMYILN